MAGRSIEIIGSKLCKFREDNYLTQEKFADQVRKAGVRFSASRVSKIEMKGDKPDTILVETFNAIARAFGMDPDDLFDTIGYYGIMDIRPGVLLDCHGSHLAKRGEMIWTPLTESTAKALIAQADIENIPTDDLVVEMLTARTRRPRRVSVDDPAAGGTPAESPAAEIPVPPGRSVGQKARGHTAKGQRDSQKEAARRAR